MLVHHFVEYYARNFPDNRCLTRDGHTTSYGELDELANRYANGLLGLGVEHGQRVAVLGENSLEHLVMFMAACKIGAVTVSLNYRLAPAELAFILKDANARAGELFNPIGNIRSICPDFRPFRDERTLVRMFDRQNVVTEFGQTRAVLRKSGAHCRIH